VYARGISVAPQKGVLLPLSPGTKEVPQRHERTELTEKLYLKVLKRSGKNYTAKNYLQLKDLLKQK